MGTGADPFDSALQIDRENPFMRRHRNRPRSLHVGFSLMLPERRKSLAVQQTSQAGADTGGTPLHTKELEASFFP